MKNFSFVILLFCLSIFVGGLSSFSGENSFFSSAISYDPPPSPPGNPDNPPPPPPSPFNKN